MIRINLLPVRAAKKKETAKQQIIILIVSVVAVAAVVVTIFSTTLVKINTAKKNIVSAEEELKVLKAKIGEIDNIKKLQEEVKKKLDVLGRLRKERTGPANRLAKLSEATPDKLWITRYVEMNENVSLSGVAYTEDLIADFIRNLIATKEFMNVELLVSEQIDVGGVKAKKFDITCVIVGMKKEEPKVPGKK